MNAIEALQEIENWSDENWYESPDSPESYECTPVVNLIDLQKKIKEVMKTSQTKGR